jgi:hypothetical protein
MPDRRNAISHGNAPSIGSDYVLVYSPLDKLAFTVSITNYISVLSDSISCRSNISLVINIYFLFCRTNSVRDLIFV